MESVDIFNSYYEEYEAWFEKNKNIYLSELNIIKSFIPDENLKGIEIGIGSGRFALPLGIKIGVEPSEKMAEISTKKGLKVIRGFAEELPFEDNSFDFALMVTTICFLDEPLKALRECKRIIKSNGFILVGFVPLDSFLGKLYEKKKENSKFYRNAHFYTTTEVINLLSKAGFSSFEIRQTLFDIDNDKIQPYEMGYDRGGFVVIKSYKL